MSLVRFQLLMITILSVAPFTLRSAGPILIDSSKQWNLASSKADNLAIDEGLVTPSASKASFRSILFDFDEKVKADQIVFKQSPAWLNWNEVDPIGPANGGDAPVALALGPNDYWLFRRYKSAKKNFTSEDATLEGFDIPLKTTQWPNQFDAPGGLVPSAGGYHAWQSRDMVNWVHHGAVSEKFSRWVTTAEYEDGKFYIYYDYPNDQDPHVYVDEDLFDGKPGTDMGMAFRDPSHGSDCAVIRDLDGNFHIIYENWDPISANKHSWDSPLAGRAVSSKATGDFKIEAPAVDYRTTPTGVMAEFKHPHWLNHPDWDTNIAQYEIHEPEQDAYGDWAAISIGGQYYLFGDFHPAGKKGKGSMSTAWFTSSSLEEPFLYCGHIGSGHPDPDILFAEGQFYLITQTDHDFVSPGPWVDTVEARVGVDTTKNGRIDEWTGWQEVTEHYDYVEGFAKQISSTPAAIDLSSLPAGYGFVFEYRTKVDPDATVFPVMDSVTLTFN